MSILELPAPGDVTPPLLDSARRRRLILGGGAHAFVRLFSVIVTLATAPILARYLGTSRYGEYVTVLLVFSLFVTLGDGGLSLLVTREWPVVMVSKRAGWFADLWRLRIFAAALIGVIAVLVALLGRWSPSIRLGLLASAACLPFVLCGSTAVAFFAAELAPGVAAFVEILTRIGWLLGLLLALIARGGVVACVVAAVGSQAMAAIAALLLVRARVRVPVSVPPQGYGMGRLVGSAATLALLPFAGLVYARADTLILATTAPLSDVGVYGLSYRVLEALQVIAAVAVTLVTPLMVNAGGARRVVVYRRSLELLGWVFFPVAVGVAASGRDMLRLLGGEPYLRSGAHGARPEHALALLMIALVLMIAGMVNGAALLAARRDRALLGAFGLVIPANLALAAWWSAKASFVGTAAATLTTEVVGLAYTTVMVRRELGPLALRRTLGWPLAAAAAAGGVLLIMHMMPLLIQLVAASTAAGAVLLASPLRRSVLGAIGRWDVPPGRRWRWARRAQANVRYRLGQGDEPDRTARRLIEATDWRGKVLWVGRPRSTAGAVPVLRRRRASVFVAGAQQRRLGRTRFGDPRALPWPGGTFDVVLCDVEAFDEGASEIGAAKCVAELARVVKDDGQVVLCGDRAAGLWEGVPGPALEVVASPGAGEPDDGPRFVLLRRPPLTPEPTVSGANVNLACGDDRRQGWINLDIRPVGDLVADVGQLPLRTGSVASLRAQDILEHFWRDEHGRLLAEWRRALCPGGLLELRVPNLGRLTELIRAQQLLDEVVENIYGAHRFGPGGALDTHHWGWTAATLERDLLATGFRVTDNDQEANMEVRAVALRTTPRGEHL